jgi:EmrB/QacA subfamily drug resistance transporter
MGQLDASIVTLALPRLGAELNAHVGAVEWVALSYLLVLVATVAIVGRIADAVGRKLLYVYGFAVFTAGSALCGLAPTLGVLIAARVLQAIGAAMLQANSIALITEATPRPQLGRAIGVQGTAQALGLALGPAVGGALMALGGWRLIFLVNIPAGAVGLVLGWLLVPRSRSRRPLGKQDRPGALLLAIAAVGPMAYLSLAGRDGYADPALLLALAAGIAAAVAFVRRERRIEEPLIDLSLFGRPALRTGLSTGLISYLVLFGTLFVVPYYLTARGAGAAQIGLELSVLPVALGIAAPIAGRLVTDARSRLLTGGGMVLTAAGLLAAALSHDTAGQLGGLALTGLGLGAFTPANNATIMAASPAGHTGSVGGVLNMTRGLGTALGVTLTGALFTAVSTAGHGIGGGGAARALTVALAALAGLALAAGVALLRRSGAYSEASTAASPSSEGPGDAAGDALSAARTAATSSALSGRRVTSASDAPIAASIWSTSLASAITTTAELIFGTAARRRSASGSGSASVSLGGPVCEPIVPPSTDPTARPSGPATSVPMIAPIVNPSSVPRPET